MFQCFSFGTIVGAGVTGLGFIALGKPPRQGWASFKFYFLYHEMVTGLELGDVVIYCIAKRVSTSEVVNFVPSVVSSRSSSWVHVGSTGNQVASSFVRGL